jgi:uncharacterized membrane protein
VTRLPRALPACAAQAAVSLLVLGLACRDSDPPTPSEPPASAPSKPAPSAPANDSSPVFFRVQGVASDDVLNIRSNPDSGSRLLGTIAAGASAVEGIGAPTVAGSARWQRVRHGGTIGWVNARFLSPDDAAGQGASPGRATSASLALLAPLICFGTEPFWAIRFNADGSARYEAMGEAPAPSSVAQLRESASGDPESFDLRSADRSVHLRAAMRKTGRCCDVMSDLLHPYEFAGVGTPGALYGCCRVDQASAGQPRP